MASNRLDGLDALRGIAAICVLIYHATGMPPGTAYLAVDLFFMLSGYVMARAYEKPLGEGLGAGRFFQLRLKRLWPTMFAAGLLATPVFLWTFGLDAWPVVLTNLLLIPTPWTNRVFPLNGPAWSIFFELVANAAHGLVLHRISTRGLAILALIALLFLGSYAEEAGTTGLGAVPATMIGGFPRVAFSYLVGIILFRTWQDAPSIAVSPVFAFLAMPVFFGLTAVLRIEYWYTDLAFIVVVCPLVMAGGLRAQSCWPLAHWAGAVSFPLYAFHAPVLRALEAAGQSMLWGIPLGLAVAAGALWGLSAGSRWLRARQAARTVEQPLPVAAR